jgi:ligand-binding sensor domain-containing protein/anti-sigma regulatory factor (Ser/Thr protein kinase)
VTESRLKAIILFICSIWSLVAPAQQPLRFDRLGRNEGLSQGSVNCMMRDSDGFMWFGTQDGLNMYDGKKFRVFQNQPGDPNSLSNNYIVSICEDEEGFIWIGTMTGGLDRFDKRTEQFRTFIHSDSVNSISENTVWTVLSDSDGYIWAGTSYGLNRYEKKSGLFKTFRPLPGDSTSLATDLTVSLFNDRQGRLWVGTVEGLCLFDKEEQAFIRFYNPLEKELKGANIIWSVSQVPSGEIITGTDNGVYLLDPGSRSYRRILGAKDDRQLVAWSVTAQPDGAIWAGTDRGLFLVDPQGNSPKPYLHDPVNPQSLTDNNVWSLLRDPSGFLWTGTNNGICKTKTSAAHFHLLAGEKGQSLQLSSSKVMAILEDRSGFLWIGTDGGGLNCIGPDRKSVTVYNSDNSDLKNNNVWALAEDEESNIYLGNYQGGLHRFDRKTGVVHHYPVDEGGPYSLSNRRVLALLVGQDCTLWIGTRGGGLNRLDPRTGKFTVYLNAENDKSGFPATTVLSLAQDNRGRIWAGTQEGGLALYDPSTDSFRVFKHIAGEETSLSDNNIWAIEFDNKGRLWAGTQGGLNVAEEPGENMKFRYFTIRDGLRSNIILGIKEDTEGNLWISSFSGIAKLDIAVFESLGNTLNNDESYTLFHPLFTLFDPDHGLQGLEFNQGSSHKGYSGTLYFGGNNGLNYFMDKEVKASDYMPPIVITGFKIFNKEVLIRPVETEASGSFKVSIEGNNYTLPEKVTYINELKVTYRESVFSFEFASLDLLSPHKNQYAYKMTGFDGDWNYMGTQNTATYTNLDPGEYTLILKGSNSDGVWNPLERSLKITIIPPFWRTTWFIALSVIIIILTIFFIVRTLLINQQRKAQREKELIELQLKTIKSQIDPHFAFNAINTIASFIFADKPDVTYDYFTRFARMIRNILEDDEKISRLLSEEIEFVRNYLELQKMRFKDKFEYSILLDEQIPANTQVPKMIIQSYAENSIKHGLMHRKSGGLLKIAVTLQDSRLVLVIEDNGVGREKAAQLNPDSTHRGFRIMERTIGLYSKLYHKKISQEIVDLRDEHGTACGTRVILTIYMTGDQQGKQRSAIINLLKHHG